MWAGEFFLFLFVPLGFSWLYTPSIPVGFPRFLFLMNIFCLLLIKKKKNKWVGKFGFFSEHYEFDSWLFQLFTWMQYLMLQGICFILIKYNIVQGLNIYP